jgi:ribose 5-phosphate isomerase A
VTNDHDSAKARAAHAAASLVESGMIVGLGSGSTAALMIRRLGERVKREAINIVAVATSRESAISAERLCIPIRELDDVTTLDISLDGADEIDPQFRMIKGHGGALLREKIVASVSNRRVTMITADKRVDHLGTTMPLPIEVSLFGIRHTEHQLKRFGASSTTIRVREDGSLFLTDSGNGIIDCQFSAIDDPGTLDCQLQAIAGVLKTGLFLGLCDTLIVGTGDGVEQFEAVVPDRT